MRVSFVVLFLLVCCWGAQSQTCNQGCGNGVCEPNHPLEPEDCRNCPFDCGLCPKCDGVCGNQLCDVAALENACNCPEDCGVCCEDGVCRGEETAANCPKDCAAPLVGEVYDIDTLAKLSNASVTCRTLTLNLQTSTADDGSFSFDALAKGYYTCTGSYPDYTTSSQSLWFQPGASQNSFTPIRIGLRIRVGHIVGRVIDGDSTANLRGANVSCAYNRNHKVSTTNTVGKYFMESLNPGFYNCTAGAPGYGSQNNSGLVVRGQTTTVNFVLYPLPATLVGKVIDGATNLPIKGASIRCNRSHDFTPLPNTTSDGAGGFVYAALWATEYVCVSYVYGYSRGIAKACLVKGETTTITLIMEKVPSVLTGYVFDKDLGTAIYGATIRCASSDALYKATTSDSGKFTVLGVVPNLGYVCDVTAPTYFTLRKIVEVPPATTVNANFPMDPMPGTVQGTVTDPESKLSLANFTVICVNKRLNTTYLGSTDSAGKYSITDIPSGPLQCTASGPRYDSGTVSVTMHRAETIIIDFQLTPTKGSLKVTVQDSVTLLPLDASVVCTSDIGITLTLPTAVATNGTALSGPIRIGFYTCTATSPRYLTTDSKTATITRGVQVVLQFFLAPAPGALTGTVFDEETKDPLNGFKVVCTNRRVNTPITVSTNTTGNYFISSIESGAADCTASGPRYNDLTKNVTVLKADLVVLDFPLTPSKGNLVVNVRDSITGLGIAGASVICAYDQGGNGSDVTDANGQVSRANVRVGTYVCGVSADNYGSVPTQTGVVVFQRTLTLNFTLVPNPGSLSGLVFDEETNIPLPQFQVRCVNSRSLAVYTATTDTAGRYAIASLDVGSTDCTASGDRYNAKKLTVVILKGQASVLDFPLTPSKGNLVVNVRDSITGLGVAGASVVCAYDLGVNGSDFTDANGQVSRANVRVGTYVCGVSAANYGSAPTQTGVVVFQATLTLNFTLIPTPGSLSGKVFDSETLVSLVNFTVNCVNNRTRATYKATTDSNGQYRIASLDIGATDCTASGGRYNSKKLGVTILKGEASVLDFPLDPTKGNLIVNVKDSVSLTGISGAKIACTNDFDTSTLNLVAGADGTTSALNVRIGLYTCVATADKYQTTDTRAGSVTFNANLVLNFTLSPNPGAITGKVYDVETLVVLQGFSVSCTNLRTGLKASAITNAAGQYSIDTMDIGNVTCTASGFRYNSKTDFVLVVKGDTAILDFALLVMKGNLRVIVQDAAFDNKGISGATVSCTNDLGTNLGGNTDVNGTINYNNVVAGQYTCSATLDFYTTASQTGNVTLGGLLILTIVISPTPANITGLVFDSQNSTRGLGGASVICSITGGVRALTLNSVSAADGTFSFNNIIVFGNVYCTASVANFATGNSTSFAISRGIVVNIPVGLVPLPMTVRVTVVDGLTGGVLGGALTLCSSSDTGFTSPAVNTTSQGLAIIPNVPRGTYVCSSSLASYFSNSSSVSGIEGATVSTTITLFPLPGGLSITVQDSERKTLIPNALVYCFSKDGASGNGTTDVFGNTVLTNLPVNTYTCQADGGASYLINTTTTAVTKNAVTQVTIFLAPRRIRVSGTVTNVPADSKALVFPIGTGIKVTVTSFTDNTTVVYTTGGFRNDIWPDGYFEFLSRIPVSLAIFLEDPAGAYDSRLTSFTSDSLTDVVIPNTTINLAARPPSISGYVFDISTGLPLAGVSILITAVGANSTISRTTETNSTGRYFINTLPFGNFSITAALNEYIPQNFPEIISLSFQGQAVSGKNFSLVRACCGNIQGRVIDSGNQLPVANANITVFNATTNAIVATNVTGPDGVYFFYQIAKGRVSIRVTSPGFTQSSDLLTTIQPGVTNIQTQQDIQVAIINVKIFGRVGTYNNATGVWTGTTDGTFEIDLLPRNVTDLTKAIQSSRVGQGKTDYTLEADWRQLLDLYCFDIRSSGDSLYVPILVQLPPLQPLKDVNIDCAFQLKSTAPNKRKELNEVEEEDV